MSAAHGFRRLKRSAEHGFTLVELIVAMSIGSLLLASLGWSVASLGRELAGSRALQAEQSLRAAMPAIRHLIEQARPTEPGQSGVIMSPDRYTFVASPPAALGAVGLVRVSIYVEKGDALALRANFDPVDPQASLPLQARQPVDLVDNLAEARFDFVKADEDDRPPRLVTLHLTDRAGRRMRLAVATMINGRGACRFDPISMTCRP